MNKFRWIGVVAIALFAGSIALILSRRSNHWPPAESPQSKADPLVAGSHGLQPAALIAGPENTEKPKGFRMLPVLERKAILSDIRKRPLREIFELWQRAGVVEKDLMKQGALETTMANALREQNPSREFLDDMWRYVVDSRNSSGERAGILGMFGLAKTVEGMEFLIKASKELTDSQLRRIALDQISTMGDLRGDGSYHEERSPPLERVWQGSADQNLLSRTASAMAKIGAPSGINMLLNSALDDNPANSERRRAALFGLEQVYSRNATSTVAALLARQTGMNEASTLATKILVNIGDESAAEALIRWFQETDASSVGLAAKAVGRTRTPALLKAWKVSLGLDKSFRSEEIRAEIREALERYHKGISIEK